MTSLSERGNYELLKWRPIFWVSCFMKIFTYVQEFCVTKEKLHIKCFVLFYCFACKNCNLPFSILDCAEDQRSSFESRLSTYSWAVLYMTHSSFITFVPSLTVILWLTLFNASATLLPSTKKAEDSPLKEWNYKNNVFP